MQPGQNACNKCIRSGITCVPYNFAQKHIDEDAVWKAQATSNLDQLNAAVQYLLQHNHLPELANFTAGTKPSPKTASTTSRPINGFTGSPADVLTESPSIATEYESDLFPAPMSNLYSLTESGSTQLNHVSHAQEEGKDLIGGEAISLAEAEYLFGHYRDLINPLLWAGVLCPHRTLHNARKFSPLLVAAVLTVAALHTPGRKDTLQSTYDAFTSLVSSSCLLPGHSLDDIRGLCLGAFYLTNISWRLCGQAVRMATEMSLHQSAFQLLRAPSKEMHDRLRMWYVLYVCDHQLAIAYGRPPIMHDDAAVRNVEKFLSCDWTTNGDVRLIAQVNLFRILTEVYLLYGCDPALELSEPDFERLRLFNVSIDQWRLAWQSKSADIPTYGSYPSKGTILYYHFARFQLNALSLRGISARKANMDSPPVNLSWERREAANLAISAATSTLNLIIEEIDLYKALSGVPIFTHTMIAMCASFLLKMAVVFGTPTTSGGLPEDDQNTFVPRDLGQIGLTFRTGEALALVENLARLLSTMAENVSHRHLASHIVAGLQQLLQRFVPNSEGDGFVYYSRPVTVQVPVQTYHDMSPAHPISEHQNDGANAVQLRHLSDMNFDPAPVGMNIDPSIHFNNFNHDAHPASAIANFDWHFDDSFLGQMDGQGIPSFNQF